MRDIPGKQVLKCEEEIFLKEVYRERRREGERRKEDIDNEKFGCCTVVQSLSWGSKHRHLLVVVRRFH